MSIITRYILTFVALVLMFCQQMAGQEDNVMRGKFYHYVDSVCITFIDKDIDAARRHMTIVNACVQDSQECYLSSCLQMLVDIESGSIKGNHAMVDNAISSFKQRRDDAGLRCLYIAYLAKGYQRMGSYKDNALRYFSQSQELAEELGDSYFALYCKYMQSEYLLRSHKFNMAAEMAREVLEDSERLEDNDLGFFVKNILIRTYTLMRAYSMAEFYLKQIEHEGIYRQKKHFELFYLQNKLNLLIEAERYTEGRNVALQLEQIVADIKNPLYKWRCAILNARVWYYLKDIEKLKESVAEAERYSQYATQHKLDERYTIYYLTVYKAYLLTLEGKYSEAQQLIKYRENLTSQVVNMCDFAEVYYTVYCQIERKLGEDKHAYELLAAYEHYRDSIAVFHTEARQKDLTNIYQNDSTIRMQKMLLEQKSEDAGKIKLKFVLGFMLTLMAVLVISGIVVMNRRKERKEDELRNIVRRERLKAEVERQTAELQKKNDQIEAHNRDILQSEQYAKRIQRAIMPDIDAIKDSKWFSRMVAIYRPLTATGGDFYWYATSGDTIYVILADCSGHGIPGAMMSMMGVTLVNDIMSKMANENNTAAQILQSMHENMVKMMPTMEVTDWINMSIFIYNHNTRQSNFSAASQRAVMMINDEVVVLQGARRHLGSKEDLFTSREFSDYFFELHSGDNVYMFTDGVTNMMENETKDKLKLIGLESFIENSACVAKEERLDFVRHKLNEFKDNAEQTDDISFIGITIQ